MKCKKNSSCQCKNSSCHKAVQTFGKKLHVASFSILGVYVYSLISLLMFLLLYNLRK